MVTKFKNLPIKLMHVLKLTWDFYFVVTNILFTVYPNIAACIHVLV